MGKIYVVGLGLGGIGNMTLRARETLEKCKIIAGYRTSIDLLKPYLDNKKYITMDTIQDSNLCDEILRISTEQHEEVCLVNSGDSGIYGIAGALLEKTAKYPKIEVEIIPGVTAMTAGAAIAGAPIMNDFAAISLGEILIPWKTIEKRIECACMGDFVINLYNPKNESMATELDKAVDIIMKYKGYTTPVAVVKNIGSEKEKCIICMLTELKYQDVDSFTVIIIGNSKTYTLNGKMVTPIGQIF